MKNIIIATGLFLGTLCNANAGIIEIVPVSYSFDRATDIGSFNYSDWGGIQLTDGVYGTNSWAADLGNGPAYEWVGWVNDPIINIDFNLGSIINISKIDIGTVQDNVNDVVLPSVELFSSQDAINWTSFSVLNIPESSGNNGQHFTYEFNGLSVSDQYFRVSLRHSLNGPWTFTDEIDFYQNTASVPTPTVLSLLVFGLIGFIGMKKSLKVS